MLTCMATALIQAALRRTCNILHANIQSRLSFLLAKRSYGDARMACGICPMSWYFVAPAPPQCHRPSMPLANRLSNSPRALPPPAHATAHMFDRTSVVMLVMMTVAFLIPCVLSYLPWLGALQPQPQQRPGPPGPYDPAYGRSTAVQNGGWQRHPYAGDIPPRPPARVRPGS